MCTQKCRGAYNLEILLLNYNGLSPLRWIVIFTTGQRNLVGNKFTTLPDLFSMGILLSYLQNANVYLGENPFHCGCNVLWLKKWGDDSKRMRSRLFSLHVCKSGQFQGRMWRYFSLEDVTTSCNPTTTPG